MESVGVFQGIIWFRRADEENRMLHKFLRTSREAQYILVEMTTITNRDGMRQKEMSPKK